MRVRAVLKISSAAAKSAKLKADVRKNFDGGAQFFDLSAVPDVGDELTFPASAELSEKIETWKVEKVTHHGYAGAIAEVATLVLVPA